MKTIRIGRTEEPDGEPPRKPEQWSNGGREAREKEQWREGRGGNDTEDVYRGMNRFFHRNR